MGTGGSRGYRNLRGLTLRVCVNPIAPRLHPMSSGSRRWLGVLHGGGASPSRYRFILCHLIRTCDPPYEQWLVGMGAGAVPFIVILTPEGAWLLAPGPPCERVLTVAGDRCWGAISSSQAWGWVLHYSALLSSVPGTVSLFGITQRCWHPRSTLRAEARRHGAGAGCPLPVLGRCVIAGVVPGLGGFLGAVSVTWWGYEGGGTYLVSPYTAPALVHQSHCPCAPFRSSFTIRGAWIGPFRGHHHIITVKNRVEQLASIMKHKKEREKLTGAQTTLCIIWAVLHARQFICNHR